MNENYKELAVRLVLLIFVIALSWGKTLQTI